MQVRKNKDMDTNNKIYIAKAWKSLMNYGGYFGITDRMTLLELVCQRALEMKTLSNSAPFIVFENTK